MVSHPVSGLGPVSPLIGLYLHQSETEAPWEWSDPGTGQGAPRGPPGLISMEGGKTNIVSKTARSAWPGICPQA